MKRACHFRLFLFLLLFFPAFGHADPSFEIQSSSASISVDWLTLLKWGVPALISICLLFWLFYSISIFRMDLDEKSAKKIRLSSRSSPDYQPDPLFNFERAPGVLAPRWVLIENEIKKANDPRMASDSDQKETRG